MLCLLRRQCTVYRWDTTALLGHIMNTLVSHPSVLISSVRVLQADNPPIDRDHAPGSRTCAYVSLQPRNAQNSPRRNSLRLHKSRVDDNDLSRRAPSLPTADVFPQSITQSCSMCGWALFAVSGGVNGWRRLFGYNHNSNNDDALLIRAQTVYH